MQSSSSDTQNSVVFLEKTAPLVDTKSSLSCALCTLGTHIMANRNNKSMMRCRKRTGFLWFLLRDPNTYASTLAQYMQHWGEYYITQVNLTCSSMEDTVHYHVHVMYRIMEQVWLFIYVWELILICKHDNISELSWTKIWDAEKKCWQFVFYINIVALISKMAHP